MAWWKIDHLPVIFLLKPLSIGDFPASHIWLAEGKPEFLQEYRKGGTMQSPLTDSAPNWPDLWPLTCDVGKLQPVRQVQPPPTTLHVASGSCAYGCLMVVYLLLWNSTWSCQEICVGAFTIPNQSHFTPTPLPTLCWNRLTHYVGGFVEMSCEHLMDFPWVPASWLWRRRTILVALMIVAPEPAGNGVKKSTFKMVQSCLIHLFDLFTHVIRCMYIIYIYIYTYIYIYIITPSSIYNAALAKAALRGDVMDWGLSAMAQVMRAAMGALKLNGWDNKTVGIITGWYGMFRKWWKTMV